MIGTIVISLVELVQPQREAKPEYPPLKIGLSRVVDHVVSPAQGERAEFYEALTVDQWTQFMMRLDVV